MKKGNIYIYIHTKEKEKEKKIGHGGEGGMCHRRSAAALH